MTLLLVLFWFLSCSCCYLFLFLVVYFCYCCRHFLHLFGVVSFLLPMLCLFSRVLLLLLPACCCLFSTTYCWLYWCCCYIIFPTSPVLVAFATLIVVHFCLQSLSEPASIRLLFPLCYCCCFFVLTCCCVCCRRLYHCYFLPNLFLGRTKIKYFEYTSFMTGALVLSPPRWNKIPKLCLVVEFKIFITQSTPSWLLSCR